MRVAVRGSNKWLCELNRPPLHHHLLGMSGRLSSISKHSLVVCPKDAPLVETCHPTDPALVSAGSSGTGVLLTEVDGVSGDEKAAAGAAESQVGHGEGWAIGND